MGLAEALTSRCVITTTISIPLHYSQCASHHSSPTHCGLEPRLQLNFQRRELRPKSAQLVTETVALQAQGSSLQQWILLPNSSQQPGKGGWGVGVGVGRWRQSSSTLLSNLGVWGGRILALGSWEQLPAVRQEQKSWLPHPVTCSMFPTRTALMVRGGRGATWKGTESREEAVWGQREEN